MTAIPRRIKLFLSELKKQQPSLQRIDSDRNIFIGFGTVSINKFKVPHGAWEIGSYRSSWRVVRNGKIVCGSQDADESFEELHAKLNNIKFGAFIGVRNISLFDIRFSFSDDVSLEFLGSFSDDDEALHIFSPNNIVCTHTLSGEWQLGSADGPWTANKDNG
jgi:hypothetical protein